MNACVADSLVSGCIALGGVKPHVDTLLYIPGEHESQQKKKTVLPGAIGTPQGISLYKEWLPTMLCLVIYPFNLQAEVLLAIATAIVKAIESVGASNYRSSLNFNWIDLIDMEKPLLAYLITITTTNTSLPKTPCIYY